MHTGARADDLLMTRTARTQCLLSHMGALVLAGSDHSLVPPSRLRELGARLDRLQAELLGRKANGELHGAVLLRTCNRIEIVVDPAVELAPEELWQMLGCDDAFPHRCLQGAAVVEHCLGVASGLHSMVFGETQIQGQLREAFKTAEEFGMLSRRLHMLRSRVVAAARDVRHRAGLDNGPRSVASLAVDQLLEGGPRIAVVGAGETGQLLVDILHRRRIKGVLIVNRTLSKAEALAQHYEGRAMSLHDFKHSRPELDGIVFAVHSAEALLTRERAAGLRVVVDVSQPSVLAQDLRCASGDLRANNLRVASGPRIVDLDDLAAIAAAGKAQHEAVRETALAEVRALAQRIWAEVDSGTPNLGRVVDLHVEGALAELDEALRGKLSHLADSDREMVRSILLRAARRNAHYHIQDIRRLAPSP
jgi:glutamyl-tRNA reductase